MRYHICSYLADTLRQLQWWKLQRQDCTSALFAEVHKYIIWLGKALWDGLGFGKWYWKENHTHTHCLLYCSTSNFILSSTYLHCAAIRRLKMNGWCPLPFRFLNREHCNHLSKKIRVQMERVPRYSENRGLTSATIFKRSHGGRRAAC